MRIFATLLLVLCVLSSSTFQQTPTEMTCMDATVKAGVSNVDIKIVCGNCQKWSIGTEINTESAEVVLKSKCTARKSGAPLAGKTCSIRNQQVQNTDEVIKLYLPCYDMSALCNSASWGGLTSISSVFILAFLASGYF